MSGRTRSIEKSPEHRATVGKKHKDAQGQHWPTKTLPPNNLPLKMAANSLR